MKDPRPIKEQYCEKTGKYRYHSEAKANRAIARYDEIQRAYFCSCDAWHTTKRGLGKGKFKLKPTKNKIRNRLAQLKKKL